MKIKKKLKEIKNLELKLKIIMNPEIEQKLKEIKRLELRELNL